MTKQVFHLSLLLLLFVSCKKESDHSTKNPAVNASADSLTSTADTGSQNSTADSAVSDSLPTDGIDSVNFEEDCVRGEPEPVSKLDIYPNREFKIIDHIGYETVPLKSGDLLKIENGGCEYYTLVFTYSTAKGSADLKDYAYWSDFISKNMEAAAPTLDLSSDLYEGLKKLRNGYAEGKLQPNEEISYGNDEMPTTIQIDSIFQQSDSSAAVVFTYSIGPL